MAYALVSGARHATRPTSGVYSQGGTHQPRAGQVGKILSQDVHWGVRSVYLLRSTMEIYGCGCGERTHSGFFTRGGYSTLRTAQIP